MNDWDRWRPAVTTFGILLAFALLLWFFGLRSFTETADGARESFEGSDRSWQVDFNGTAEMASLLRDVADANTQLDEKNTRLLSRMGYHFVNSTLPAQYHNESRPAAFINQAYEKAKDAFRDNLGNRQVDCSLSMALGFDPLIDYALTVDQAEMILRRFEVMSRVQQLLVEVIAMTDDRLPDGIERALMRIDRLDCAPAPVATGAGGETTFLEYRATVKATMTLAGLLELLRRAGRLLPEDAPEGTPTPFHAVRDFSIEPAKADGPNGRARWATRNARDLPGGTETRQPYEVWYTPYFEVTLVLATLEALDETNAKFAPGKITPPRSGGGRPAGGGGGQPSPSGGGRSPANPPGFINRT